MAYRSFPDWKAVVKDKHLIFDTDAIISIIDFNALDLLDEFRELGVTFTFINPVLLELMNTNSSKERIRRGSLLSKYEFVQLPLQLHNTLRIQES